MALRFIRQLYSLDTLDTRFIVPATTPPREALEEAKLDPVRPLPVESAKGKSPSPGEHVHPPRWRTLEFYFYYVSISASIYFMIKLVHDSSVESHASYKNFSHLLSDGWIPGRKVDNVDAQYAGFRQNIPYLFLVVMLHPLLRKAYDSFWRAGTYTQVGPSAGKGGLTMGLTPAAAADARLDQRISFDLIFAAIFLVALHGFSAFKIAAILYANYCIAKKIPRSYVPAATWIFNVGTLFANEFSRGYSYASIIGTFLPSVASEKGQEAYNIGHTLDSYGGLIPRWEVLFNFTILRLISYNLDYYWSLSSQNSSSPLEKQLDPSNLSERDRVTIPAKPSDFSFRNYFAYAMYSPLYLAGPILTFNDYISQCRYRTHSITTKRILMYALRFAVVLLTMEVMIHYLYMVAIFHAKPSWSAYTPAQLSMLGFFNLKHIWLKLLIPWRFFRLWALLDGIDAPENMVRCMSDNYSVTQFWRGWHRSFNKWVLRYLYIPLGGSRAPGLWGKARQVVNYLMVFTFIAIWHDIQLRLLMWGWLVTLFVLPEIIASAMFPEKKWKDNPDAYRWLCGVGAVGEILMLMAANLVGFSLGVDGLKELVAGIFGTYSGWSFLATACVALFTGVQFMFEWRENEKRRGIRMKC
ncbi:similar to glycerol:H+ symporter (Gup1) [Plenodomus lingam JN3]|uniref:Similar to glycerol:H+ symporter (Gup1) n=1 Tax=Leptosphaeria maculans (strain JN3 / isolate v23.1.3 / race Av1-4-5-6-7-8) TaxID=985895 RepID=E5A2Y8_LEPMJ|nr:similar to glycerol:H+ symporter (Gup1) [Plenodomus lingam JN3]CBX98001.1 similar to glycerol:H+ symporter (Gup1) [Plenodomus lingam JN3]